MSSKQFDSKVKLNATAAIVGATLLRGCELWAPLAEGPAARIEVVHTRWLRQATDEFRVLEASRLTDAEVRITYAVPFTHAMIVCRRLAYLSSFGKASPFFTRPPSA